ncbi:MAG TPA: ClpX C4-type zinc finger protein [Caulobacteraceae bacterium]
MPKAVADKPKRVFRCSFCRKPQTDVVVLISGPGVLICDECVALCVPIVADVSAKQAKSKTPRKVLPDETSTDHLMSVLGGYNGAFEAIGESMQDVVDILREREISWAAIGEQLGVSRQAAWKRFG